MSTSKVKAWRDFELFVAEIFKELDPTCQVNFDQLIQNRQIDVEIRKSLLGTDFLIIVQVKYYKNNVPVTDVDSFESVVRELQANKGIIVTNKGFTRGAKEKAKKTKIELYSVLDSSKPKFQKPSLLIPIVKSSVRIFLTINYQFTVLKAGKSLTLPVNHLADLSKDFMKKWLENKIDTSDGTHESPIDDLPEATSEIQINSGHIKYEVKRRYHFKKMKPSEYRGFQSFVSEKFTPAFIKFENISIFEDKSWEFIPDISEIPIKVSHLETEVVSSNATNEKFIHVKWKSI